MNGNPGVKAGILWPDGSVKEDRMKDHFGREIDYLRVSVTDRCNLRCTYCMPEEGVPPLTHAQILRFSEILRICEAAADLGIHKVKVTGGEPLVRKGIVSLIHDLKQIPGIEQVTMTTNGILLGEMYEELAEAGLDAVTVSLDAVTPESYRRITRRDELGKVLASLETVKERGLIPCKINCVALPDTPDEELGAIAGFAREAPVHVRFIELMPLGHGSGIERLPEEACMKRLFPYTGLLVPFDGILGNGPARYYTAEGFRGKIGFISAISHAFCDSCNRLRLTSEGFLKSCLYYDTGVDLRPALEEGGKEALRAAVRAAVERKPLCHSFRKTENEEKRENTDRRDARQMSQIGG